VGRKRISKELQDLIFLMVAENPTWGAPRIHGELLKLGFDISERTVSRWARKAPKNPQPAMRWQAFLDNHREAIAAMDFFTVPTLTFGVLYCFFMIAHDRRQSCIATSQDTQPASGSRNNCARHFPTTSAIGTWFMTAMPSSETP
jgi:hypothetical protein